MLTVLAPGLTRHRLDGSPVLARLSARADRLKATPGYARNLCALFGLDASKPLPIAAACWLADMGQPPPDDLVLAEPVRFGADISRILAFPVTEPDAQLADLLCNLFNQHFGEDHLRLIKPELLTAPFPQPDGIGWKRWYVLAQGRADFAACPLEEVLGKVAPDCMPHGADQAFWRRIVTETQMLFHKLVENAGAGGMNGLWFAGAGALGTLKADAFASVSGKDALLIGLAKHAGIRWDENPGVKRHLHVVPDLSEHDELAQLEALLARALDSGRDLMLHDCMGTAWRWKPWMRFRFWRG